MPRRPPTTTVVTVLGTAALPLSTVGCAPESPQENVSQACASADPVAASLEEFRNTLTPDATIEQLRTARDKARTSSDDFMAEVQDVARDRGDELDSDVDAFQAAVDDVPNDTRVPDALDSLRNESDSVDTSLSGLKSELNC